jgi:hypothetical protein
MDALGVRGRKLALRGISQADKPQLQSAPEVALRKLDVMSETPT